MGVACPLTPGCGNAVSSPCLLCFAHFFPSFLVCGLLGLIIYAFVDTSFTQPQSRAYTKETSHPNVQVSGLLVRLDLLRFAFTPLVSSLPLIICTYLLSVSSLSFLSSPPPISPLPTLCFLHLFPYSDHSLSVCSRFACVIPNSLLTHSYTLRFSLLAALSISFIASLFSTFLCRFVPTVLLVSTYSFTTCLSLCSFDSSLSASRHSSIVVSSLISPVCCLPGNVTMTDNE